MFRFLPGIFVVQVSTVALVLAMQNPGTRTWWITVSLIVIVISLLASFWFSTIADSIHKDTVSRVRERYAKEREKLRVRTEREKSKVLEESHRQVLKDANRAHAKANFKVGLAAAGAVGAGLIMLFTELLTMGLLTLSTAGGALLGYGTRARQDRRAAKAGTAGITAGDGSSTKVIEADEVRRIPAPGAKTTR